MGKQPPRLWCSFKTPCPNIVGATSELLSRASREDGKNSVVTGVSDPSTYKPRPQWKERFWRLWITHCVNIVPVTLKDSGICISKYWTIIFNKVEHNFGLGGVHPSFPPQMYYPCSYFYCSWANCSHEISVVQLLKGKLPPFLSTVPYGVKGGMEVPSHVFCRIIERTFITLCSIKRVVETSSEDSSLCI